jgi:hypothetical protein
MASTQILRILLLVLAMSTFSADAGALPNWVRTAGPGNAGVNVLFQSGSEIFAGTMTEGVARSTNGGASWFSSTAGLEGVSVKAFTANASFLFAGVEVDDFGHGGVYRSSNGGSTWTPANTGITNSSVLSLLTVGSAIYMGDVGNGIMKSTDNGNSWFPSNGGIGNDLVYGLAQNGANLFAIASQGVFRSTNNGGSWVDVPGTEFQQAFCLVSSGTNLYTGGFQRVGRSTNGGATWTFFDIDLPELNLVSSIAVNGTTLYAATSGGHGAGVYRSTNNGVDWAPANGGIEIASVNSIVRQANGTLLAGTPQKGILASTNEGVSWLKSSTGLPPGGNIRTIFNDGSTILAGTGGDGIYRSTNHGASWTSISQSDNGNLQNEIVSSIALQDGMLFASTLFFDGIYRSTNNGASWTQVNTGVPGVDPQVFALEVSGANLVAGTRDGIIYSTNHGDSWNPTNVVAMGSKLAKGSSFLYAIVETGFFTDSGIYRSSDNGQTWLLTFQLGASNPTSLEADGTNVYVGDLLNGMLRSTNNGLNWQDVTPEPDHGVFAILALPGELYAGLDPSSQQCWRSTNNGNNWMPIPDGLAVNTAIEAFGANSTYVFAGTNERGVWRRALSGATDVLAQDSPHSQFVLEQSPNPFRFSTEIAFRIPRASWTRLTVYDVQGREVQRLVDRELPPGAYTETFNAAHLPAGMYVVRMEAGAFEDSKKMLLVR